MTAEFIVDEKEFSDIANKIAQLGKEVTNKTVLEKIALTIKNNIFQRTQAGKDVNFQPFAKYSSWYAQKEGKTIVNLAKTGGMLNSMTQKVLSNDTAKIFFTNKRARELALKHQTGEGVPVRNFFGVSVRDRQDAQKEFLKQILEAKRKLAL